MLHIAVGEEVNKLIGISEDYSLVPMETLPNSNGPVGGNSPSEEVGEGHVSSEEEL